MPRNSKFISIDGRVEKITKGLCYYYDKPYAKGYRCHFKEPQLFTIEMLVEIVEDF